MPSRIDTWVKLTDWDPTVTLRPSARRQSTFSRLRSTHALSKFLRCLDVSIGLLSASSHINSTMKAFQPFLVII
jgi:hypothetical protein